MTPVYYNYANAHLSQYQPSAEHLKNNKVFLFFSKYLLEKCISVYKWNMPETWAKDYFLYTLYCKGFLAVVNTDKFGVIPQQCTLSGYDVFYRPTNALITNPLLSGMLSPRIGTQCEIIKLQNNYSSILDIVTHYAEQMALCSESVNMNLFNSHLAYVFAVGNKAAAESVKRVFDKVASGEVAVVYDKALQSADGRIPWETFTNNLSQNYIADRVLQDLQTIESLFDSEIGIPAANTVKKERLTSFDLTANNIETVSRASLWLENLQEGCEKVNKMFGLNLSVDWRIKPDTSAEAETAQGGGVV